MKITIAVLLFIVFSLFSFIAEYIIDREVAADSNQHTKDYLQDNPILTTSEPVSTYEIDVDFDETKKPFLSLVQYVGLIRAKII